MSVILCDYFLLLLMYFYFLDTKAKGDPYKLTSVFCLLRILTSWEVSAIGHPLVLPLKTCEELKQLMDDSNSSLPTSLRCMKEYKVRQPIELIYDDM